MNFSLSDEVGGTVSGTLALIAALIAVRRYLRDRRQRGWWNSMNALWRAQREAGIVHAYRFAGGYVPPLSDVYVPRTAVPRLDRAGGAVAVRTLLTGTGHVLLIGEPGSGKTALVRQAGATSAQRWLDGRGRLRRTPPGPVVLSLPAAALVTRALPAALAEEYRQHAPEVDFERRPAPGRQWLVCVDGVDGVADPDDRALVLNRLAGLLRPPAPATGAQPWRLLVTTRQLPEAELAVLGDGCAAYHLALFSDVDVELFATRWFPRGADGFLDWTRAQRISAPVHNPLTATIAALVWEGGRTGPHQAPGETALLDQFVDSLLAGVQDSVDAARDALLGCPPEGAAVAAWLTGHRTELVEVAAAAAVDGADPVAAVVDWSAAGAPQPPARVLPGWSGYVRRILLGTGLFRADRHVLTSVWPSLVEYLAAGPLARDWRRDRWVEAMTTTSHRGLAVHAFSRSAVAPGFLSDVVVDPAGAIAAGHLLAAGGTAGPEVRADVLGALLTYWSAGAGADPGGDAGVGAPAGDVGRECFSLLTTLAADRHHRESLHDIATDPGRSTDVRRAVALFFAARRRNPASPRQGLGPGHSGGVDIDAARGSR